MWGSRAPYSYGKSGSSKVMSKPNWSNPMNPPDELEKDSGEP